MLTWINGAQIVVRSVSDGPGRCQDFRFRAPGNLRSTVAPARDTIAMRNPDLAAMAFVDARVTTADAVATTTVMTLAQFRAALVAVLSVAGLVGQNLTAHPQETLQGTSGNVVPFGVGFGSSVESRTQLLVPKNELPAVPAVLIGIELQGLLPASVQFSSLQIDVAPTAASTLFPTLDGNLPVPPTTVLPAGPWSINFSTTAWVAIPFPVPYVHDGQSALVLDIRKIVNVAGSAPLSGCSAVTTPMRTDRPRMIFANGNAGSGASQATVATVPPQNPISFRLRWLGTPILRNRSDAATSGNYHGLGGSATLKVQDNPGALWVLAADSSFLPTGVVLPAISGELRLPNPNLFAAGQLDASGLGSYVLPIPNDPSLIGSYLALQAATIDPTTLTILLTNGTDLFVNP